MWELTSTAGGKPSLKIMHTSDLHIGDEMEYDLSKRALVAVVDSAIAEQVDLLIIAGDLFDSRRAARALLDFVLAHLGRLTVPVVLLPGNHDPCDETSIYRAVDVKEHHPNVHLIMDPEGELLDFPELHLRVWGKPVIEHTPAFRPLSNIPERDGDQWHVAVAHGLHVRDERMIHLSSLIPEYEIVEAAWDYLALGHIHPYRDISLPGAVACYSGSPARFMSAGMNAGHVALVELDARTGVRVRPLAIEVPGQLAPVAAGVDDEW